MLRAREGLSPTASRRTVGKANAARVADARSSPHTRSTAVPPCSAGNVNAEGIAPSANVGRRPHATARSGPGGRAGPARRVSNAFARRRGRVRLQVEESSDAAPELLPLRLSGGQGRAHSARGDV